MSAVLVLDDDPSVLTLLGAYLRRSGYDVRLSSSTESALEQIRSAAGKVDLLIADVTLPGRSGVAVAVELRTEYQGLRVLFVSGYPSEDWKDEDQALLRQLPPDVVRVLLKPFSPMELIITVDELIGPSQFDPRAATGG